VRFATCVGCAVNNNNNPALQTFDSHLRSAISKVTNSALSDIQWLHASMPVAHGGLGVRRVSSLAIPAFLASAASTLPLQDVHLVLIGWSTT